MIYITGDTHGDVSRFKTRAARRLKKTDYLIVCGDFGFVWDGSEREKKLLKWIGKRRYTTLFIDGAHENFDLLDEYPTEEKFGGEVHTLGKKLYHLKRGYVYNIDGKRVFTLGGGEGDEREIRQQMSTYWPQEIPSTEELRRAAYSLRDADFSVDYILTFEAATTVKNSMNVDQGRINPHNAFLDKVLHECEFKKWFFASYHMDRKLSEIHRCVFKQIVPAEGKR